MTITQVPANSELRSLPFARKAGYSAYRSLMDSVGRVQNLALFGDAQVAFRDHDVALTFQNGIFNDQLVITTNNGGTVSATDAVLNVVSQIAGDDAVATSRQAIITPVGFDSQVMFFGKFTKYSGDAEVLQFIGAYDGVNGYAIGADNEFLTVNYFNKGVLVGAIKQSQFSLDNVDGTGVSGFKLDIEMLNMYRVQYGGVISITFEVFGGSRLGWIPMHTIDTINLSAFPLINAFNLPISVKSEVVSGNPSIPITVSASGLYGGSIGGSVSSSDLNFFATENNVELPKKLEPENVIAIRNKGMFKGKINHIRIDLSYIAFSTEGSKNVSFRSYANADLSNANWTDVDINDSVVEVATNDFPLVGGRYLGSVLLEKNSDGILQFDVGNVRLNPNETLLITGQSKDESDLFISLRWGELR